MAKHDAVVTAKLDVEPTPRGFQTSEGWLTALKALAGTGALFLTLFGVAVPRWMQPDAPWLGLAAFVASTVGVAVYSRSRTALKAKALELLQSRPALPTYAGDVTALGDDVDPDTLGDHDAGASLLGVVLAVLVVFLAIALAVSLKALGWLGLILLAIVLAIVL